MISYGSHTFENVHSFFAFLETSDIIKLNNTFKRLFIAKFIGKDDEGFSIIDKDTLAIGITPCRLSPEVQKIRGTRKTVVSLETLNKIHALAMSLEKKRFQEEQAKKAQNNRFMKMRLKK